MKFKKVKIFLDFLSHNGQKWLVFQFKWSNSYLTNQIWIQTYQSEGVVSLPLVGANDTIQSGSNADGTVRTDQAPVLLPDPAATSFRIGDSARPPSDST
jgi:hypothetical protein